MALAARALALCLRSVARGTFRVRFVRAQGDEYWRGERRLCAAMLQHAQRVAQQRRESDVEGEEEDGAPATGPSAPPGAQAGEYAMASVTPAHTASRPRQAEFSGDVHPCSAQVVPARPARDAGPTALRMERVRQPSKLVGRCSSCPHPLRSGRRAPFPRPPCCAGEQQAGGGAPAAPFTEADVIHVHERKSFDYRVRCCAAAPRSSQHARHCTESTCRGGKHLSRHSRRSWQPSRACGEPRCGSASGAAPGAAQAGQGAARGSAARRRRRAVRVPAGGRGAGGHWRRPDRLRGEVPCDEGPLLIICSAMATHRSGGQRRAVSPAWQACGGFKARCGLGAACACRTTWRPTASTC